MSDQQQVEDESKVPQAQRSSDQRSETKWVDAWIRWPEDEEPDQTKANEKSDSSDEDAVLDPFAQDPNQTFSFTFGPIPHISGDDSDEREDTGPRMINIELQGYRDESDQAWNSTGLTVWRAAEHLCQYLVQQADLLQNKQILELGAGLGLCGIVAHQLCAHSSDNGRVVVTDGDTDALVKLRDNVARHCIGDSGSKISSHQLLWGQETTLQFLERYAASTSSSSSSSFDILLASDVVYVNTILPPLFETVQTLLRKNGIFLFAYCSRRQVPVTIDMVLEQATKAGFVYKLVEERDGIFIYQFQWDTHDDTGH